MSETITHFGYPMDVVRSALQKACRRGQTEEAMWWAWQMIEHGWVRYLWRTLRIIASEDVGVGDSKVAVTINALANNACEGTDKFKNKHFIGHCEAHAILVICEARKDWVATNLLLRIKKECDDINVGKKLPREPGSEVFDVHTSIGRSRGAVEEDWAREGKFLHPKSSRHYSFGKDPFYELMDELKI